MTLIKYNKHAGNRAVAPVFSQLVNELFDQFSVPAFRSFSGSLPAANVAEDDTQFSLELSAPGFTKEEIGLSVNEDVLTISGEKKSETKEETKKYSRREFTQQSFQRSFTLPENVDQEKIGAKFENGILLVNLPKKEVVSTAARKIQLQ